MSTNDQLGFDPTDTDIDQAVSAKAFVDAAELAEELSVAAAVSNANRPLDPQYPIPGATIGQISEALQAADADLSDALDVSDFGRALGDLDYIEDLSDAANRSPQPLTNNPDTILPGVFIDPIQEGPPDAVQASDDSEREAAESALEDALDQQASDDGMPGLDGPRVVDFDAIESADQYGNPDPNLAITQLDITGSGYYDFNTEDEDDEDVAVQIAIERIIIRESAPDGGQLD